MPLKAKEFIDVEALWRAIQDYAQACVDQATRKPLEPGLEDIVKARAAAWRRILDLTYQGRPEPELRHEAKTSGGAESVHNPGAPARLVAAHAAEAELDPARGDPKSPCCLARVHLRPDAQSGEEDPICAKCRRVIPWTNELLAWADGREQQRRTGHATAQRVSGDHLGVGIDVEG